jgi:hypothetical protein
MTALDLVCCAEITFNLYCIYRLASIAAGALRDLVRLWRIR